jgi:hypothetical protein
MFYEQRVVDIPDGLPKWSGMAKTSELIADSPSEAVKKRKREIDEEEEEEENEGNNGGGGGEKNENRASDGEKNGKSQKKD